MTYVWLRGDFYYKSFLQLLYMHKEVYDHIYAKFQAIDFNTITENDKRLCALYLLIYHYSELLQHECYLLSDSGVREVFFSHNFLLMS